jgi:uncharacterized protein (TIGR03437 family)
MISSRLWRRLLEDAHAVAVKQALIVVIAAFNLAAGTISLGSGTLSVSKGQSDSPNPPFFVTNPDAFAFKITDGVTTLAGQDRRNTDLEGGPNKALQSVGAFDARQVTISGTISALTIPDVQAGAGGHSQAFAIGLCTKGWRDQAAATYNLNLIGFQPAPAKDGFAGIAFGYRSGALYLVGYDYDNQPDQIFFDLAAAGLSSGQTLSKPLSFTMAFSESKLTLTVNGQSLGAIATSHDLSASMLVIMGASVDPANGTGSLTYSNVTAITPATLGPPAVLYAVSGDNQSVIAGGGARDPLVVGVVDALRNPLEGITVNFLGSNASASQSSVRTDAGGRASVTATAGATVGTAVISASTGALPVLTFRLTVVSGSGAPVISAVVNGASFAPEIASGGWATILGANFSLTTRTSGSDDYVDDQMTTSLDNTSVSINGKPAFVYYISPIQLNVIVPDDPTVGSIDVQVSTPVGTSKVFSVPKPFLSPALFLFAPDRPAAAHSDGTYLGPPGLISSVTTRPAKPNETILLFGTGFGPTRPPVPAGKLTTSAAPTALTITATVGGQPAEVKAYLIYPGVYQLNLTVPDLPDGDAVVLISVLGVLTQDGLIIPIAR